MGLAEPIDALSGVSVVLSHGRYRRYDQALIMSFKKAVVVSTPHKPLPLRLYCFLAVTLVIAGCSGEQLGDTNGGLAAGGSAGVVLGVGAVVATGVLLANDDDDNDGNVVGGTPPAGTPLTPVSFNDTEPNNNPDAAQSLGDLSPCLLYTSPSPRDRQKSRMPSSA